MFNGFHNYLQEYLQTLTKLKAKGVMGLNNRNGNYVLKYNDRKYYELVDDKLLTKQKAIANAISVPKLYGTISSEAQIANLRQILGNKKDFVIKPANGAGGEGILVIDDILQEHYKTVSGKLITFDEMEYYLSSIIAGLYSLSAHRDKVLVEYRVIPDEIFSSISYDGVPDIRIIVLKGYPIMAMLRLPTKQSNGKANLHQGAIGVGVNLATGKTKNGVHIDGIITHHPDTNNKLEGINLPFWEDFLYLAASSYELCNLGYIGVDMVLDKDLGALILEINARPGLNIQIANNQGLYANAEKIEEYILNLETQQIKEQAFERIEISKKLFA